ncbi:serine/arginine repetitive matrix protein 1-like isoform X2 [Ptychodera flava]|uniref:serine/arginine repetitive matrix protein 1-like isoform X2 n=1 Tax=Ptychodera flava TaxID=63121 RepID=UPI00396A785D
MPPTPRMIPFAGDLVTPRTTYQDMFARKRGPPSMMRPTSALRRNNPHPREGFLDPKNLSKMDRDARMQERVKVAVKEYLDKLKEKENKPKVVKIPQAFEKDRKPIYKGEQVLQEATKVLAPNSERSFEPRVEAVRLPIQNNPRTTVAFRMVKKPPTPKSEQPHWIAWRTQTPSTPGKVKPVYQSPLAIKRARARTPTPPQMQHPSTSEEEEAPPRPRTAPGFRMPTPPPPKPQTPPASPAQSLPPRPKTPDIVEPETEVHEVTFADHDDYETGSVRPLSPVAPSLRDAACSPTRPISAMSTSSLAAREMLLDPKLRNWVTSANDYEKQVAYNLFKSLNGGKAASLSRSMSAMGYHGRGRSPVPPHERAVKSARPRAPAATHHGYEYETRPDRDGHDDEVVREWMSEIEKRLNERARTPQPEIIQRPKYSLPMQHQIRPGSRQRYRKPPRKEYIHENSFFTNSNPTFRSHFIIAPDWVSEGLTIRKLEAQAAQNRKKHPPPGCYATASA